MLILAGNSVEVLFWQELEVSVGIVAACLPTLSVIRIRTPQAWSKLFGLSSGSSRQRKNESEKDVRNSAQESEISKEDHFSLNGTKGPLVLVPRHMKADISTEIAALHPLPPPDTELFLHYPSVQADGTISSIPPPALRRNSLNGQPSKKAVEGQNYSQEASGAYSNSPETRVNRTPYNTQREISNRTPRPVPWSTVLPNTTTQTTSISQTTHEDTSPDLTTESETPSTRSSQRYVRLRAGQSWYME